MAYSEGAWSAEDDTVEGSLAAQPADSSTLAASPVDDAATNSADTTVGDSTAAAVATSDGTTPAGTAPTTTVDPTTTPTTTPDTTPDTTANPVASGFADGVYLGTAEYTEWGDVQVEVTISGGLLVDVEAVEYPTGRRSSEINEGALPVLEAEAIALQHADVDIVSGATYTSRTYADSLQAALDHAALAEAEEVESP